MFLGGREKSKSLSDGARYTDGLLTDGTVKVGLRSVAIFSRGPAKDTMGLKSNRSENQSAGAKIYLALFWLRSNGERTRLTLAGE